MPTLYDLLEAINGQGRSERLPASIRANNPGAQWPGPSATRFGSTGSERIGGGNLIAQFDTPEQGAAAQFDLMKGKYAGMPLLDAIRKWSNDPGTAYTGQVAQAAGVNPNATLTPEMISNPDSGIPIAKAMAKFEAGRDFPMDEEGWRRAHIAGAATVEPAGPPVQGGDLPFDANPNAPPGSRGYQAASEVPGERVTPQGAPEQGGILDGIRGLIGDNGPSLMAIGGGIARGEFGEGLSEAAKLKAIAGKGQGSDDIREYEYAVKGGYKGSFSDWQTKIKKGSGTNFGIGQPIIDQATGQAYQLSQNGDTKLITDKDGTPIKVGGKNVVKDLGTHYQVVNGATGENVGDPIAKNTEEENRRKAAGTKVGEQIGLAKTQLPGLESNAERSLQRLTALENHPGLENATGFFLGKFPALSPAGRDFIARQKEIESSTFLIAIQDMRGFGALSEAEGNKVSAAKSRLEARDVSSEDYKKAIADIREVYQTGLKNTRLIASGKLQPYSGAGGSSTAPDTSAPAGASAPDLRKKYGLE